MLIAHEAAEELKQAKLAKALQRQQSLGQSFGAAESEVADHAIARFFYANGLSFAAADTTPGSYYRSMVDAIRGVKPSYVPPGQHKIAGSLLERCHTNMEADIEKRVKKANGQDRKWVLERANHTGRKILPVYWEPKEAGPSGCGRCKAQPSARR